MAIDIDKSAAIRLLNEIYIECLKSPVTDCAIRETIDFVMHGRNCLTYRYILCTALLAKATEPSADILSLQARDKSEGAYDARSLAKDVVFRFQKTMLGNILDGANSDPLVNKPGRFERLDKRNPVAGGDPKKALHMLCENLPDVQTDAQARECIGYIISLLLKEKAMKDSQKIKVAEAVRDMEMFTVCDFIGDLLDQGFGGASLVIAVTAVYHLIYNDDEYSIVPHPVNQAGSSRRQFSDLDLLRDGKPFLGTELKDKPFTASDVDHAAETAFRAGARGLLFVAGRQSSFASQPPGYFMQAKEKYRKRGMYVGVTSIDSLIDIVFSSHMDMNSSHVMNVIAETAENIGAIEAQMWIYSHMSNK